MNGTPALLLSIVAIPAAAAQPSDITTAELAAILDIHYWRVPVADSGFEWTIDVIQAVALPKEAKHLSEQVSGPGGAMISMRPRAGNEYEFVLNQGSTSSSGSFVPCKEPARSQSVCESYSIKFEPDPLCMAGCRSFVVATLEAEGHTMPNKQVVISLSRQLVISPGNGKSVVPIK